LILGDISMADVKLSSVTKDFGATRILHKINLEIRDGEFMVFVGPSGCGKSTLLRAIAGLEEISGGELKIGGRLVNDKPPAERGVAMVFQSYALYPHMNLYDNMAFGLKLAKVPKPEIDQAVKNAAKILNIEHLLDRKPKDLSGGQRQRVAIGRAIVRQPEVFLFDEPLSNLDAALRMRMRYEFSKLHQDLKTTMIYVTHDQVEAMTLADRIVVLSAGHIEQVGSPMELYEHPDNLFVAGFIGSPKMNFLQAEIIEANEHMAKVKIANGDSIECRLNAARGKPGDKVTLGIRPEHLGPYLGGPNRIHATVTFVESLGSSTQAYCDFPGTQEPLSYTMSGNSRTRGGDLLELGVDVGLCYLFDSEGKAFVRAGKPQAEQAA
jgi:multiple sugar transport system ATP-binding protein